jgi:hypothetical protein
LEVFNGRDPDSRRAAIDELWDKDGVFIDQGGVHDEGVEKINAIVEEKRPAASIGHLFHHKFRSLIDAAAQS